MKPPTKGKRFEILKLNIFVRWGDKEIKIPIIGSMLLLMIIGAFAVLLYSDWRCGKFHHDADDVPKAKIKDINK